MVIHKHGMVDLLHSTFQSNLATNSTDGIGIVNMGGEVRCDTLGCLPVCTACLSPPPTLQPTATEAATEAPTVAEAAPSIAAVDSSQLSSLVPWLAGFGFVLVGAISAWCLRVRYCRSHSGGGAVEPLLYASNTNSSSEEIELVDSSCTESTPESIELVLHNLMKSHEFSPGMYT